MSNISGIPNYYIGRDHNSNFTITANSHPAIVVDPSGKVTFPQTSNTINETIRTVLSSLLSENNFLQCVLNKTSLPELGSDGRKKYFNAYLSQTTNLENDGTKKYLAPDKILSNIGNAYNPANGVYTALKSGLYQFNARFRVAHSGQATAIGANSYVMASLQIASQTYQEKYSIAQNWPNEWSYTISQFAYMNVTQVARTFFQINIDRSGYGGYYPALSQQILGDPENSISSFTGYYIGQ